MRHGVGEAWGPAGYWQSSLDFALSKAKVEKPDFVQLAFLSPRSAIDRCGTRLPEQAYRERNGDMPFLICNRAFDPLRQEPRFQALVEPDPSATLAERHQGPACGFLRHAEYPSWWPAPLF